MKLISFRATNVHGYLNFNISFNEDVNFFSGLNGCGKTTVLKMISAMILPSLPIIKSIDFKYSEIIFEENKIKYKISYSNNEENTVVSFSNDGVVQDCVIPHKKSRVFNEDRRLLTFDFNENDSESKNIDEVLKEIEEIVSPIFLSLNRNHVKAISNDINDINDIFNTKYLKEKHNIGGSTGDSSLDDVLNLVSDEFFGARNVEKKAEDRLRKRMILDSFTFKETDFDKQLPDRGTLEELKIKQDAIGSALKNMDFAIDEYQDNFDGFFSKLEKLVVVLEKNKSKNKEFNHEKYEAIASWFINQNQLRRIDFMFELVTEYLNLKSRVYKKLNKFQNLVNRFLKETGKSIVVDSVGGLKVKNVGTVKSLSVLSSGERQIIIMFAHLVLNKTLTSEVFIIDEPELSLHISWQDIFVSAVQEANPNLQLILATHSPAIIGGRNHFHVSLNEEFE